MTQKIANEVTITKSTVTGQALLTDADIAFQALPPINTLEAEGLVLGKEFASRKAKSDKVMFDFNRDTKAEGFDMRLGKLMVSLSAEGGERIATQRLQDCGIANIPKQRRSEAKWFVETEDAARAFNRKAKKGFTNLGALQRAMSEAAKAEATKDKSNEVVTKSDVGPTTNEVEVKPIAKPTPEALVLALLEQCREHGIPVSEVKAILNRKVPSKNNTKAVA